MDSLQHYLRPPATTGWRFWFLLAAMSTATAWMAYRALQVGAAADRSEARVTRTAAALARQGAPVPKKVDPAVAMRWATLQAERDFSWGDLFAAVEKAGSEDIELLAIEPDKPNHTIVLKGAARDQKALLAYIAALARQPVLQNVHLTHQQSSKRERLDTLVFEVKAGLEHRP